MTWVRGVVSGVVETDERIVAVIRDVEIMTTPRPATFEASGADLEVFERLRTRPRPPGPFETVAFFGGATAVLVPFQALSLLPPGQMEKLLQKYGAWGEEAFMAPVRTTSGAGRWNDAEPCGGMFEGPKDGWPFEWLGEVCELGVYRDDGWVKFVLPAELAHCQAAFDETQAFWWAVTRPGFPCQYEAPIKFLEVGNDRLDGVPSILTAGPVGDFSATRTARLELSGTGWRFLDTESRPGKREAGEPEWVGLGRKVVAIVQRFGKAPLMFELAPE